MEITVGILKSQRIAFTLSNHTQHVAELRNGLVYIDEQASSNTVFNGGFTLHDVVIGVGFHWERKEDQRFAGSLKFIVEGNAMWAVNTLDLEDYLYSVIASEMSATSQLELLKAHAVTSRSWLVAQLRGKKGKQNAPGGYLKWYDREDHALFDVCADDHCQRYQGLTRANNPTVRKAIEATRSIVLVANGEVCDARFSKCCGGVTEVYDACWGPNEPSNEGISTEKTYLQSFADNTHVPIGYVTDLRTPPAAERWITTAPDAFCNTQDAATLRQVLNSYDQETADFYRWQVHYTTAQLSDIIRRKSGIDFGDIQELQPLKRGFSGRIYELKIIGTKAQQTIGKELEIRRVLSESHLYSSAFVATKTPDGFTLRGAGWGHGVGLCQIGAAVMAKRGFSYKSIVLHYFRRATLQQL